MSKEERRHISFQLTRQQWRLFNRNVAVWQEEAERQGLPVPSFSGVVSATIALWLSQHEEEIERAFHNLCHQAAHTVEQDAREVAEGGLSRLRNASQLARIARAPGVAADLGLLALGRRNKRGGFRARARWPKESKRP